MALLTDNKLTPTGRDNRNKTPPFLLNASRQMIDNVIVINKFGFNDDLDSGGEDINDQGDLNLVSTAAVAAIVSSSANDDLTGTGAEKVLIYGIDENYDIETEEVTLNGTTDVNTTTKWFFIYRMKVTQSNNGANDAYNAGDITATVGGSVIAQISTGNNQTLLAAYMIPRNYEGYLYKLYFDYDSAPATDDAIIELWAKEPDYPFQLKWKGVLSDGNYRERDYDIPLRLPEKTIVKCRATTGQDNTDFSAGFDMVLMPTS